MHQNIISQNQTSKVTTNHFLEKVAKNCYMDKLAGQIHCRKCHNVVHIDIIRHYAFCPKHGPLI